MRSCEDVLEVSVTDFCRCNEVSASGSNGVVSDPYAEYETRSGFSEGCKIGGITNSNELVHSRVRGLAFRARLHGPGTLDRPARGRSSG
ncbi:hypothetical protein HPB52_023304 [Rhipicephalus sanguineus]|uniref:Uncharacterized protein n=1 Tax=Rhipicephalus sanguineus TaxID=34632 RepID=A0A9D4TC25_RHISA|nr:hypothetical protein HPB52_023304 [Rhipicephalus sanguineus]